MEETSIHDADFDAVNSDIGAKQNVPAIVHHSKSTLPKSVARIFQIALIQIHLTVMHDRIILPQSMERYFLITYFYFNVCLGVDLCIGRNL